MNGSEPYPAINGSGEGSGADAASLIEKNSFLVYGLIKRFSGRGTETEELIQSGFLGLAEAAAGFDPSIGASFSTYAFRFVEGAMRECIRKNRIIPVPRGKYAELLELRSALESIRIQNEDFVRLGAATVMLGMEEAELNKKRLELELLGGMLSLDNRSSFEQGAENYTLGSAADCGFEENSLTEALVNAALKKLKPIEQNVIAMRFFDEKTQQETAKMLNISQSAVSKNEKAALIKLRDIIKNEIS